MIPSTPEQWLSLLTARLDARQSRLSALRDYLAGNPPLPEGVVNDETAYRDFQLKSRTNFAELVVDAVAERMRVGGFTLHPLVLLYALSGSLMISRIRIPKF